MAVVTEMKASNGATVRIHDDAYTGVSREEMRKRQQAVIECAKRITVNAELRRLREAREARETREAEDESTD
ncbi:MAG: hypothetical protein NC395_11590 [Prevotella sp.]|nr:hypothetical protein [Prevotella sp.]